jgi:hypothetical protein
MNPQFQSALDDHDPLPETYGRDWICALIQSPSRLYVYWELKRDPFLPLREAFGPLAADYKLAVRVKAPAGAEVTVLEVEPTTRNYWLEVKPGREYVVEVGLSKAQGQPFICLLTAEKISTPPAAGMPAAQDGAAAPTPCGQAKDLRAVGAVHSALEVLFALDRVKQGAVTPMIARMFSPATVPAMTEGDLIELQDWLIKLSLNGGYLPELEYVESDAVAQWMIDMYFKEDQDETEPHKRHIRDIPPAEHLYDKLYAELCAKAIPVTPTTVQEPSRPQRQLARKEFYYLWAD